MTAMSMEGMGGQNDRREGTMAAADKSMGQLLGRSPAGSGGAAPPAALRPAEAMPAVDGDGKPKKKGKWKGKKKLILVVMAVLLLGGGGYAFKEHSHKSVYKPGQPVPAGAVTSLGTLTVNTSDGHLVQVGIDLQLTEVAVSKTVSADMPELRNAAIADLGDQTYPGLLAPAGRAALQRQLLRSFQKVLGPVDGAAPQVSAVYFTSFILQ